MKKFTVKIISFTLIIGLLFALASCKKQTDNTQTTTKQAESTAATTTASKFKMNPLTGVYDLDPKMEGKRPVAVMINNINIAKSVQTGVGEADMVFETYVEGGITRMMAVWSDISKVGRIGTVRSARYTYAELAYGLDARYVHAGADNKYGTPLMNSLGMDRFDLGGSASSAAQRYSNGLASEHTLYTFGDKLYNLHAKGRTDINSRAKNVYSFNDEDSNKSYKTSAKSASVFFSSSYTTNFTFDSEEGKYYRGSNGTSTKDYLTGKKQYFKNVLVLFTTVQYFSDNHHVKTVLSSGEGVYLTEGTQVPIKWKKGGSSEALRFFTSEGKNLKLNAGNSFVCLTKSSEKGRTVIS